MRHIAKGERRKGRVGNAWKVFALHVGALGRKSGGKGSRRATDAEPLETTEILLITRLRAVEDVREGHAQVLRETLPYITISTLLLDILRAGYGWRDDQPHAEGSTHSQLLRPR